MIRKSLALAVLATVVMTGAAEARDQIRIVGSSTVFPFTTRSPRSSAARPASRHRSSRAPAPAAASSCSATGVGVDTADITNASRAIKKSEVETCAKNGVTEITEVKIGFDGIVLANSKAAPQIDLTLEQLCLALAKDVPDGKAGDRQSRTRCGATSTRPCRTKKIEVLGPPPTSGTRDAFVELAMEGGCDRIPALAELKKTDEAKQRRSARRSARTAPIVEAGENDNLIVQKLEANPDAFGIFGYSFLDQNADKIQGSLIDGVDADLREHLRPASTRSRARCSST